MKNRLKDDCCTNCLIMNSRVNPSVKQYIIQETDNRIHYLVIGVIVGL
jgi:hypothetical protein